MFSSDLGSKLTSNAQEGLKSIASQIMNILKAEKRLTYAQLLELIEAKNSNTLKRRTYDVLSIMRALNLVKKQDKNYILLDQRKKVISKVHHKTKHYEELKTLKLALEFIINRNKKNKAKKSRFFMPFIVVYTEKDSKVDCETTEEGDFFKIKSEESIEVVNDLSIVSEVYRNLKNNVNIKCQEEVQYSSSSLDEMSIFNFFE